MGKRASIFDLDGTIRNGLLITELPHYLAGKGLFDKGALSDIAQRLKRYEDGLDTYREMGNIIPLIYARGIKGQRCEDVESETAAYVRKTTEDSEVLMPFTRELLGMFSGFGRKILISGSPEEAVMIFSILLDFDVYEATRFGTTDAKYDGTVVRNLATADARMEAYDEISLPYDIDPSLSYAFGNTAEDFRILQSVGHGYLIDPDEELAEQAERLGIKCTTRSDIIGDVRDALFGVEAGV